MAYLAKGNEERFFLGLYAGFFNVGRFFARFLGLEVVAVVELEELLLVVRPFFRRRWLGLEQGVQAERLVFALLFQRLLPGLCELLGEFAEHQSIHISKKYTFILHAFYEKI
jgi:GNAT superfamily N-acetyltransferase